MPIPRREASCEAVGILYKETVNHSYFPRFSSWFTRHEDKLTTKVYKDYMAVEFNSRLNRVGLEGL